MESTDRGFSGIELSLRDYVAILTRHKWLFGGVFLGVLVAAAAWTAITPAEYQSSASVVLRTNNNQQLFPSVGSSQRSQFIRQPDAELEYVSSSFFAAQARDLAPPSVSVRPRYDDQDRGRSSQLSFVATAGDPFDAQAAAAAWADAYLELRATNDVDEIQATIASSEALIGELEIEKAELLEPLRPIDDALLEETDSDTISRLTTQRLSLRQSFEDELLPISLQLRTLSQDLANLRIASGYVTRPENSARLSIEPEPGRKVAPQATRNMALAGVLGLMLAAGAALLNESFRGVINSTADLSSLAPAVPMLAQIPEFGRRTEEPLDLAGDAGTPYAQAFERVVSALLYERLLHDGKHMSVLVTSSVSGEGKTTVASHLALRLDATPTATILLDADLRRPDVHATFGEPQMRRGLSHLLQDRAPLLRHLEPLARAPRVRALFAGAATDDAAALLRQAFPAAVESLSGEYDLLVVDAPPVLAVTDAEVMAHSVDGVVVVVRAGKTSRSQLSETLRKLAAVDAHVIGFVLVGVKATGGYGYAYSYAYQSEGSGQQLSYSPELLERADQTPVAARAAAPTPAAQSQRASARPAPSREPAPSPEPAPAPSPERVPASAPELAPAPRSAVRPQPVLPAETPASAPEERADRPAVDERRTRVERIAAERAARVEANDMAPRSRKQAERPRARPVERDTTAPSAGGTDAGAGSFRDALMGPGREGESVERPTASSARAANGAAPRPDQAVEPPAEPLEASWFDDLPEAAQQESPMSDREWADPIQLATSHKTD